MASDHLGTPAMTRADTAVAGPDPGSTPKIVRFAVERGRESCFFFDFDGTISPIVADPEAAEPAPGVIEALAALTPLVRNVAIVSARPIEFLSRRLAGLPHQTNLFGLYGLESRVNGKRHTHPEAAAFEPVMIALAGKARAELPDQAFVEFKRLSVAIHFRTRPELQPAVEQWAEARAAELGLRLQPGRMVVELKPPVGRDKGSVVAEQIVGASGAWFFGDDLSDLRAFAALDEREQADPGFLGVRVQVSNPESGSALRPAADLHLAGPHELPAFLAALTERLRAAGSANR